MKQKPFISHLIISLFVVALAIIGVSESNGQDIKIDGYMSSKKIRPGDRVQLLIVMRIPDGSLIVAPPKNRNGSGFPRDLVPLKVTHFLKGVAAAEIVIEYSLGGSRVSGKSGGAPAYKNIASIQISFTAHEKLELRNGQLMGIPVSLKFQICKANGCEPARNSGHIFEYTPAPKGTPVTITSVSPILKSLNQQVGFREHWRP